MIAELCVQLQKAVDHLSQEFSTLRAGTANVTMVDGVMVTAYESQIPLKSTANLSCPDNKTIRIEPWDKSIVKDVEKALHEADLGIAPQNMGDYILLSIPPMTEDRRRQVVKRVGEETEKARISIRNVRYEFLKTVKSQKDGKEISEDEASSLEKQIQGKVDEINKEIDEKAKKKEQEILNV